MNKSRRGYVHAPDDNNREQKNAGLRLHKDWRAWLVVLLMLAAMAVYLLSMDESIPQPEKAPRGDVGNPFN